MKHGVILGKHLDISRAELFAQGIEIEKHYLQVAVFDDTKNVDFTKLAWIVKRGEVIRTDSVTATDLIGVSSAELGNFFKKKWLCRRYKDFDPLHTDEEIKNKWKEYIRLDKDFEFVLEITGYQDISRFSCIDFDKPVNSMQIGMMPAKLTQIMVNIATGKLQWQKDFSTSLEMTNGKLQWQNDEMTKGVWTEGSTPKGITVYDPFMWLGTTYMVANSMWYNVLGSDINITPAKQNLPWWEKQAYYQKLPLTLFSHDVTQSINKPMLKHVSCIVTEWWLGHIISGKTKPHEIAEYALEIEKLYKAWINNMMPIWEHMIIVCSIPWHVWGENKHVVNILQHCEWKGIRVETVPQVYTRAGQKVGRKLVTLRW